MLDYTFSNSSTQIQARIFYKQRNPAVESIMLMHSFRLSKPLQLNRLPCSQGLLFFHPSSMLSPWLSSKHIVHFSALEVLLAPPLLAGWSHKNLTIEYKCLQVSPNIPILFSVVLLILLCYSYMGLLTGLWIFHVLRHSHACFLLYDLQINFSS